MDANGPFGEVAVLWVRQSLAQHKHHRVLDIGETVTGAEGGVLACAGVQGSFQKELSLRPTWAEDLDSDLRPVTSKWQSPGPLSEPPGPPFP